MGITTKICVLALLAFGSTGPFFGIKTATATHLLIVAQTIILAEIAGQLLK